MASIVFKPPLVVSSIVAILVILTVCAKLLAGIRNLFGEMIYNLIVAIAFISAIFIWGEWWMKIGLR